MYFDLLIIWADRKQTDQAFLNSAFYELPKDIGYISTDKDGDLFIGGEKD